MTVLCCWSCSGRDADVDGRCRPPSFTETAGRAHNSGSTQNQEHQRAQHPLTLHLPSHLACSGNDPQPSTDVTDAGYAGMVPSATGPVRDVAGPGAIQLEGAPWPDGHHPEGSFPIIAALGLGVQGEQALLAQADYAALPLAPAPWGVLPPAAALPLLAPAIPAAPRNPQPVEPTTPGRQDPGLKLHAQLQQLTALRTHVPSTATAQPQMRLMQRSVSARSALSGSPVPSAGLGSNAVGNIDDRESHAQTWSTSQASQVSRGSNLSNSFSRANTGFCNAPAALSTAPRASCMNSPPVLPVTSRALHPADGPALAASPLPGPSTLRTRPGLSTSEQTAAGAVGGYSTAAGGALRRPVSGPAGVVGVARLASFTAGVQGMGGAAAGQLRRSRASSSATSQLSLAEMKEVLRSRLPPAAGSPRYALQRRRSGLDTLLQLYESAGGTKRTADVPIQGHERQLPHANNALLLELAGRLASEQIMQGCITTRPDSCSPYRPKSITKVTSSALSTMHGLPGS